MIRVLPLALALVACRAKAPDTWDGYPSGTSVDPGPPAAIAVEPTTVTFGKVDRGASSSQQLTIRNDADGDLELHDLSLGDPTSAFDVGDVGSVLVPGHSSTDVTVTFRPDAAGDVADTLTIESNDPDHPTIDVPLTGIGHGADIAVDPTSWDFGDPLVGCRQDEPITITNVGDEDLFVSDVSWRSDDDQYLLWVWTPPPATLLPGGSMSVTLSYMPTDDVRAVGTLTVTSDDPLTPEVTVHVVGTGTHYADASDTFVVPEQTQADILFVVDDSSSMDAEQDSIAINAGPFVDALVAADVDYHLGVIATDTSSFLCDPIRPTDADPHGELASCLLAGTSGSDDPQGAEMAYEATAPGGDASATGPYAFLSEDVPLAVFVVSDEDDDSEVATSMTVADYTDALWARKDFAPDQFRWYSVIGDVPTPHCATASAAGTNYAEMSTLTGGTVQSICSTDWGLDAGTDLASSFHPKDRYTLSAAPVPGTISVSVDGVAWTSGWTYDVSSNQITFEDGSIPEPGAVIEVSYQPYPDCPS